MSLYDQIGGEAAVDAAVDIFYQKVLVDERVRHFFDSVDMKKQNAMQKSFLTMAFGGPNHYAGKGMRAVHQHLNLNETHFTAIVDALVATLQELSVKEQHINAVVDICLSVKDDVLNQ